ncbi:MAG TPA: hypothetical protein VGS41_04285, partial [Chthonomonadales bacterium]|nr:hypothetical protein [Chthonomonadales bacterium]
MLCAQSNGKRLFELGLVFALALAQPMAHAFPQFARKYNLPCARCHSMEPRLTPFGYAFYRAGFRLPANQLKPITLATMADAIAEIDYQKSPGVGGANLTMPEVDLVGVVNAGKQITAHVVYIQSASEGVSSGLDETWAQYNSGTKRRYFSARVGQMPVSSGYQMAGGRNITLTDPMLIGATGPNTLSGEGAFAISNLERGVELGYTAGTLYNRVSWLQ